jgi:hypothetical protein
MVASLQFFYIRRRLSYFSLTFVKLSYIFLLSPLLLRILKFRVYRYVQNHLLTLFHIKNICTFLVLLEILQRRLVPSSISQHGNFRSL